MYTWLGIFLGFGWLVCVVGVVGDGQVSCMLGEHAVGYVCRGEVCVVQDCCCLVGLVV